MEKFEIVKAYEDFKKRISDLEKVINPTNLQSIIQKNEEKMLEADFWNDNKKASKVINECNNAKDLLASLKDVQNKLADLHSILELDDEDLYSLAEESVNDLAKVLDELEINNLLNGEYDNTNAIVELHPGAGGTESQDWALMLYRMYKRFAERKNFEFDLLDYQDGLEAGIKSVTFLIKGKNAYGILKGERGVHRLVRISPFDSNARRHTSFVGCNVTPEIIETNEIKINDEDLRIDTYRASGAGGQHVNRTDSAVRITHLPTGIVVSCQSQRSQIQNKERAMMVLKSKLFQLEEAKKQEKIQNISGGVDDNSFGSQIRSYVLHPYAMVKDHRTQEESSNPNNVLDGDIEKFINSYLKYNAMKGQVE